MGYTQTIVAVTVIEPPAVSRIEQVTLPVPEELYALSTAGPAVNFIAFSLMQSLAGRAVNFTVLAPIAPANFSWEGNNYQLALVGTVANSYVLDFPNILAGAQASLDIVARCTTDSIALIQTVAPPPAGLLFDAYVSAANQVTIVATNISAAPINPPATTFNVRII